jgi:hypothetical protein
MEILQIFAEVVGLSGFIFAAVAWIKQFGVKGKALTGAAFAFGLVFGVSYRYALAPMVTFSDWFWAITFGFAAGFLATGAYKGMENASGKARVIEGELLSTYQEGMADDEMDSHFGGLKG